MLLRVRSFGRSGLLLALLCLGLAACAGPFPQTTLEPKGDFARMVDSVFRTTLWLALVVFVLVEGALIYAIVRFRGKPGDAEPKQVHGNTTLEVVWTAIPALILAVIAVPTVKAIFKTYQSPDPNAVRIEVIGHQWWWEFRYPEAGVVTANEIHVPVGRTVDLRMTSSDVIHAFWVPQFAAKRDVFPKRNTVLWFKADVAGEYPGQCTEFCGEQHGRMAYRIIAEEPAAFDAYLQRLKASGTMQTASAAATLPAQQPAAAVADTLVGAGQKLFTAKGCLACHSLDATKPIGIGPNLANIGARTWIGAGTLTNTDENLARWIRDPQAVKHGVLMPNLGVTEAESKALVAYLRTRK